MGIRILIVEDDAEIADYLVRGLREEGFAVTHAVTAMMPGTNCRAIRGT